MVQTIYRFYSRRNPESYRASTRVHIAVDRGEKPAQRRMAPCFGHHCGVAPDRAIQVSIKGSPAKCTEGLMQVVQSGAVIRKSQS